MPPRFVRNQRVVYFSNSHDPDEAGTIGRHGVVVDLFKRRRWTYVVRFLSGSDVVYAREDELLALPGGRPDGELSDESPANRHDQWLQQPFGLLLLQQEIAADNQTITGVCHLPGCRWATVRFEKSALSRFAFQLRAAATDDPEYAARIDVRTPKNSVLNRAVVLETLSSFLSVSDWRDV